MSNPVQSTPQTLGIISLDVNADQRPDRLIISKRFTVAGKPELYVSKVEINTEEGYKDLTQLQQLPFHRQVRYGIDKWPITCSARCSYKATTLPISDKERETNFLTFNMKGPDDKILYSARFLLLRIKDKVEYVPPPPFYDNWSCPED